MASKAPYGEGAETLVDETVRKSWQIDATKVRFSNPQWEWAFAALVRQVAGLLGTESGRTEAHLYKLLLYETGGHFKPHKDTEKEPGMFGTLVRYDCARDGLVLFANPALTGVSPTHDKPSHTTSGAAAHALRGRDHLGGAGRPL